MSKTNKQKWVLHLKTEAVDVTSLQWLKIKFTDEKSIHAYYLLRNPSWHKVPDVKNSWSLGSVRGEGPCVPVLPVATLETGC